MAFKVILFSVIFSEYIFSQLTRGSAMRNLQSRKANLSGSYLAISTLHTIPGNTQKKTIGRVRAFDKTWFRNDFLNVRQVYIYT